MTKAQDIPPEDQNMDAAQIFVSAASKEAQGTSGEQAKAVPLTGQGGGSRESKEAKRRPRRHPRAPEAQSKRTPPLDPHARRRVLAEYHAGYYAADRLIFIHRPDIHTEHVWTVDADGVLRAEFEEVSHSAPGDKIVDADPADPTDLAGGSQLESSEESVLGEKPLEDAMGEDDTIHSLDEAPNQSSVDTLAGVKLIALDARNKPIVASSPAGMEDISTPSPLIASAIQIARLIEGPVSARIVTILYRMANDPPNWRRSQITFETDTLMDELGYERTVDGGHHTRNRERVRDALLALQRVEIRAERWDPTSRTGRSLYRAPLIYVRGGTYDRRESANIPLGQLLEYGLPKQLTVELGWYSGVRESDGKLGNNYVLLPRAASYYRDQADHGATVDALLEFLYLARSLRANTNAPLTFTRDVVQRRAGIYAQNITRARHILDHALSQLKARGFVVDYTPVPKRLNQTLTIQLAPTPLGNAETPSHSGSRIIQPIDAPSRRGKAQRGVSHLGNGPLPPNQSLLWEQAPFQLTPAESSHRDQGDEIKELIDHPEGTEDISALEEWEAREREEEETTQYVYEALIGGVWRRASDVWRLVSQRLEQKPLSSQAKRLMRDVDVCWRLDRLLGGDIQVLFVLRVPHGVAHVVEAVLLNEVAAEINQFWPRQVGTVLETRSVLREE